MDGNNYYDNDNQMQYDEYPAEQPLRMNVQGQIGMILGIVGCVFGIACGWYPAFTVWPALLDIAAIALGIVGLTRKGRKKGMATAGLILGIVGIVLLIIAFIIAFILGIVVIGGGAAATFIEELMRNVN